MSRYHPLFRWLVLAALVDWLVTRTLLRMAIFMPKSPLVIEIYQALGTLGQFASILSAVLAIASLIWLSWQCFSRPNRFLLALTWLSLIGLSLVFMVLPPIGWLALIYHLIFLGTVPLLVWQSWVRGYSLDKKVAATLVGVALLAGELYQTIPLVYHTASLSGSPAMSRPVFNAGELFIPLSTLALWWAYGRSSSISVWLLGVIPALVFTAARLASPAMSGIIAIWSTGMTLYLPWPLYTLSLWLAGVTVITTLRRGDPAGFAILLLITGGYAPQLSTQAFLGLIALWLLAPASLPPLPETWRQRIALTSELGN